MNRVGIACAYDGKKYKKYWLYWVIVHWSNGALIEIFLAEVPNTTYEQMEPIFILAQERTEVGALSTNIIYPRVHIIVTNYHFFPPLLVHIWTIKYACGQGSVLVELVNWKQ